MIVGSKQFIIHGDGVERTIDLDIVIKRSLFLEKAMLVKYSVASFKRAISQNRFTSDQVLFKNVSREENNFRYRTNLS